MIASLNGLLDSPAGVDALLGGLGSSDWLVRRVSFSRLLLSEEIAPLAAIRGGLGSDDVVVRLRAAQAAGRLLDGADLVAALDIMSSSSTMRVRSEALEITRTELPHRFAKKLLEALFDPRRSIREIAHFYLKRSFDLDPAAIYRDRVRAGGESLREAILGLSETAGADAADDILRFAESESSAIRQAAIAGLARLDRQRFSTVIYRALWDQVPRVRKQATSLLVRNAGFVSLRHLREALDEENAEPIRAAALEILERKSIWAALSALIEAAVDDSETIAAVARRCLRRAVGSVNRVFTSPTEAEVVEIEAAFERHRSRLPPELEGELGRFLGYVRKYRR